jgi:lipid A 4'-phosphatase
MIKSPPNITLIYLMDKKFTILGILLLVLFITLWLSPQVDYTWSLLPYSGITNKFYGEVHLWCRTVYAAVPLVTWALLLIPALLLYLKRNSHSAMRMALQRMALISYLSIILGPGLIVNLALKDHWGRARPYQVIRDHHSFSLPWQPHFNRAQDNSFPSGHVAIGAFIGVPLLACRRYYWGGSLCFCGFTLVGLVRYLQGGHYFSDIILAALIVWTVTLVVATMVDRYFLWRQI